MPSPLTLQDLEARIESSFLEAGRAFREIKRNGLYKADYRSFKAYCKDRWDLAVSSVDYWINAADIADGFLDLGFSEAELPHKESAYRELAIGGLDPELKAQAWVESQCYADRNGLSVDARIVRSHIDWLRAGLSEPIRAGELVELTSGPRAGAKGRVKNTEIGGGVVNVVIRRNGELEEFPALPAEIRRIELNPRKNFKLKPVVSDRRQLRRKVEILEDCVNLALDCPETPEFIRLAIKTKLQELEAEVFEEFAA